MKNTSILESSTFIRISNPVSSIIDGEVVVLSIDNGEYSSLNSVASEIWHLLKTKNTFKRITEFLITNYDVDEDTCKAEISEYLEDMIDSGLILICDE